MEKIRIREIVILFIALSFFPVNSYAGSLGYYDMVYTGKYRVSLEDPNDILNCRSGPGIAYSVDERLTTGQKIVATKFINKKKPWFRTSLGCYVRANSAYLIWAGGYEDPSTMCDWRRESC